MICGITDTGRQAVLALSILGDFVHNFTDGLALSASYLASTRMGVIQTMAIFLHEIPHEVSDYAILVKHGMTLKGAMYVQILTALGCLLGSLVGFVVQLTDLGTQWVIPFTAGGFLYIACVQGMVFFF